MSNALTGMLASTEKQEADIQLIKCKNGVNVEFETNADYVVAMKTNELMQADVDKHLENYQKEKHNSERLKKQLDEQLKSYKELVVEFRKLPGDLSSHLEKECSMLSNVSVTSQATKDK